MGYKRKPKQYRLKFESPDMDGFECLANSVSVDRFVGITQISSKMASGESGDITPLLDVLCEAIVEWNLEDDDGHQLPVGRDVLGAQDIEFAMEILTAWMGAIASVNPPSLPGLKNGEIPPEVSAQLGSLSRNLPS